MGYIEKREKKGFVRSALGVSSTSPELSPTLSGWRRGEGLSPPWVSWGCQQVVELWWHAHPMCHRQGVHFPGGMSGTVLEEEPCECTGSGGAPEHALESPSFWWQECAIHWPRIKIKLLLKSHLREKAWGEHIPLLAAVVGMLSEGIWGAGGFCLVQKSLVSCCAWHAPELSLLRGLWADVGGESPPRVGVWWP